jgi:molecular chaperone GrpE
MTDSHIPTFDELADAAAAEQVAADAVGPDMATSQMASPEAGGNPQALDPVAEAQRALADQQEKYVRLYAEFENFRKRASRERVEAEQRGMGAVMKGLMETLDDLARVVHMTPEGAALQGVLDGVSMVEKKLHKSLAGHGLEIVNPVDAPFDPALHEAITTAPATHAEEDNRVAQVFQVGYRLNGTLLRPAMVVVKQWNG